MFSCEFWRNFFFTEQTRTTASENPSSLHQLFKYTKANFNPPSRVQFHSPGVHYCYLLEVWTGSQHEGLSPDKNVLHHSMSPKCYERVQKILSSVTKTLDIYFEKEKKGWVCIPAITILQMMWHYCYFNNQFAIQITFLFKFALFYRNIFIA